MAAGDLLPVIQATLAPMFLVSGGAIFLEEVPSPWKRRNASAVKQHEVPIPNWIGRLDR